MDEPRSVPLTMWGTAQSGETLPWEWASRRLEDAPFYWLATTGAGGTPHVRPVWGVWLDDRLLLTVGSPGHRRNLAARPSVSVHVDGAAEVVVVEGIAGVEDDEAWQARFLDRYDRKYDWDYDLARYGPPAVVRPGAVLAWTTLGEAGRDGFGATGKWLYG